MSDHPGTEGARSQRPLIRNWDLLSTLLLGPLLTLPCAEDGTEMAPLCCFLLYVRAVESVAQAAAARTQGRLCLDLKFSETAAVNPHPHPRGEVTVP